MQRDRDDSPHGHGFLLTRDFSPDELHGVNSVAARLLWAIKKRETNQLQVAKKAGLSTSHINRILKRGEKRPGAGMTDKTAAKVAKALDISLHWLLTGEGQPFPFEPYLRLDDPRPNRQVAAQAHMILGTDPRAIAQVVNQSWADENDPSPKVWAKRIEAAEEQLRRGD